MRELTKYITEKLDINKVKLNNGFPIDGEPEEIIEFLKNNKFEKVEDPNTENDKSVKLLNRKNKKCFAVYFVGKKIVSLEFADTSKEEISINNPLYYIGIFRKPRWNSYLKIIDSRHADDTIELTSKEFEKEINMYFKK